MRFKVKRSKNCYLYKGHFYYVGQEVNINVDKLIQSYRENENQTVSKKTYTYMNSIREKRFIIEWIERYPRIDDTQDAPLIRLSEFSHYLDTDDLILKNKG